MQKKIKDKTISFRIDHATYLEIKKRNLDVSRYFRECLEKLLKETK